MHPGSEDATLITLANTEKQHSADKADGTTTMQSADDSDSDPNADWLSLIVSTPRGPNLNAVEAQQAEVDGFVVSIQAPICS